MLGVLTPVLSSKVPVVPPVLELETGVLITIEPEAATALEPEEMVTEPPTPVEAFVDPADK